MVAHSGHIRAIYKVLLSQAKENMVLFSQVTRKCFLRRKHSCSCSFLKLVNTLFSLFEIIQALTSFYYCLSMTREYTLHYFNFPD